MPYIMMLVAALGTGVVGAASDESTTQALPNHQLDAAIIAERQAETELAVGAIRLTLLRAKTRLARHRYDEAITLAWRAIEATEKLPPTVKREPLIEPLEQLIVDARAQRGGRQDAVEDPTARRATPQEILDGQRDLADATAQRPAPFPDQSAYDEIDARLKDQARYDYQVGLERQYKTDEADLLARMREDRRIPSQVLVYPGDWKARSQRRLRKGRSGVLFAGEPFQNAEGEVVQTVVYDIQSLLVPIPHFTDTPEMDMRVSMRNQADRAAMRYSSEIFTGYARDLAEGLPLMQFFGGVDAIRATPGPGLTEQSDLMRIVNEVLQGN